MLTLIGVSQPEDRAELRAAFRHNPQVELQMPHTPNWLNEKEVYRAISTFDVGVAPMVNHLFNEAKSGLKVKQYFACSVPVLASPVGEQARMVQPGYNGFICRSPEAFRQNFITLHKMKDDPYRQMCENARESAKPYLLDTMALKWYHLLTNLT